MYGSERSYMRVIYNFFELICNNSMMGLIMLQSRNPVVATVTLEAEISNISLRVGALKVFVKTSYIWSISKTPTRDRVI